MNPPYYLDTNDLRYNLQTNSYNTTTLYPPKKTSQIDEIKTPYNSPNKTTRYERNSYTQKKIPQKPKYDESIIQTLIEFGVPRERCIDCLNRANGDIAVAANLYYSNL
eukprot:Anaeramoba_flamelloidesa582187_18.p1 GENE.a582187_18~~a582187_18.p1  ORF type:complete len:108 (+),score=12.52 a582187_18:359-682(+)